MLAKDLKSSRSGNAGCDLQQAGAICYRRNGSGRLGAFRDEWAAVRKICKSRSDYPPSATESAGLLHINSV